MKDFLLETEALISAATPKSAMETRRLKKNDHFKSMSAHACVCVKKKMREIMFILNGR